MKANTKLLSILSILAFLTIAVMLYIVSDKLLQITDASKRGRFLILIAAILATVVAVIKLMLLLAFNYVVSDENTFINLSMLMLFTTSIALPILIGLGYSNLKDSVDWKYNNAAKNELLLALGLSFLPPILFVFAFFVRRRQVK